MYHKIWMKFWIMMCFNEGSLVLRCALVIRTLDFSQFFTLLHRICLRAKVRNLVFIICSLPVGIFCLTEQSKVEWISATFSCIKNKLFCPQFSPENSEIRILGLWNFKIFWGSTPPRPPPPRPPPPRKRGLTPPCRYSRLLYSNLLPTSFLIETPEVVRAFAFYQCRLGCNHDVDDACGLKLLLVLSLAWRGFSLGTPVFLSWKTNISKFNFD